MGSEDRLLAVAASAVVGCRSLPLGACSVSFNRSMTIGVAWLSALTCAGYWLEGRHGSGAGLLAVGVVLAGIVPFPLYLREKGRQDYADAILALMWGVVLIGLVPFAVEVGARGALPLRDGILVKWDQALGVSVPAVVAWSNAHRAGWVISSAYPLLIWVLALALFLPVITGRAKVAREFVLGNLIAFAVGLPLFVLLPAVGPWYGFHFAGNPGQLAVQGELLALRGSVPYTFHVAGVICFPSFHVIWAILAGRALWAFRWLRWPAAVLCSLIALSTLTSGWHYFADVFAGGALAAFAVIASERIAVASGAYSGPRVRGVAPIEIA